MSDKPFTIDEVVDGGLNEDLEFMIDEIESRENIDLEDEVFNPKWPSGLEAGKFYTVPCDDKGRNGGSWLKVMVSPHDGDVYVSMQDWERIPEGNPSPLPSLRSRTAFGGGRNSRTHQALLWLARAIQLDEKEAKGRAW